MVNLRLKDERWENPLNGRYYEARIMCNLFGEWELQRVWGRMGSRLGRIQYEQHASFDACALALEKVRARRLARGYSTRNEGILHD